VCWAINVPPGGAAPGSMRAATMRLGVLAMTAVEANWVNGATRWLWTGRSGVTGALLPLISWVPGQQLGALMPSGGPLQQSICCARAMAQAAFAVHGPAKVPATRKATLSSEMANRRGMARPG
jgi:hypothetical protein